MIKLLPLLLLLLAGCNVNTGALENNIIKNPETHPKYQTLKSSIPVIDNPKVCALTTSTANLLYTIKANLVAAPQSDNLLPEITKLQSESTIGNLGSSLAPNLEIITTSQCDITFISDAMPHSSNYDTITNLVTLPQTTYQDIIITLYTLNQTLGYDKDNKILNQLNTDTTNISEQLTKKINSVTILQASENDFYISNSNSFLGSLVAQLKIKNDFENYPTPNTPINHELLLTTDPNYILLYGHGVTEKSIEDFKNNPAFTNLTAVKNNQVIFLPITSTSADLTITDQLQTLVEALNEI